MADSYFVRTHETPASGRYLSGPSTSGPWDDRFQHGGPPSALAVLSADRLIRHETGRNDLIPMRVAVEFVGPVPVAEIETHARVLRAARSAALVAVSVSADDRQCLLARVWFVRDADTSSLAPPGGDPIAVPDVVAGLGHSFGYGASLEWRFVRGRMGEPGPAAVWARPNIPLVADRDVPGLARVALIADSASGISAELDWAFWSFLNVDLDVHLARPPQGDWLLLDAATQLGAHGCALARSTLSDTVGVVGSGLQTLVVGPLPTRK